MNEGLKRAKELRQKNKELGIQVKIKNPIEKANENPKSLRFAINGKCWDCVGAGHDPNPRAVIRDCRITDCTLWNVRPYQLKKED